MSKCSRHHCQYHYHASAYGLAAEIERPVRQSIHAQAASVLSGSGGRGSNRVENFREAPFFSFDAAYTEVGGSFDDCHNVHTTYSMSVIEGLNIADVVTADRIVCRIAIYSPEVKEGTCEPLDPKAEHVFDITGSHFQNLRIAGHSIEVELASRTLQDTHSKFEKAFLSGKTNDLLPWGNPPQKKLDELAACEKEYHPLIGTARRAKAWNSGNSIKTGSYRCSPAGHLDLAAQLKNTTLKGFGSIILVPKFGVVRLAEMVVEPSRRNLAMISVQMASPGSGSGGAGGGNGGSTDPYP